MSIQELLQRTNDEWATPHRQSASDLAQPDFELYCRLSDKAASAEELAKLPDSVSTDMLAFWKIASNAKLFVDRQYGQWGLEILSPSAALKATKEQQQNRPSQYQEGDIVIGRFLGDAEILLLRRDKNATDFGRVLVALPVDPRKDWYLAADTFGDFLRLYFENQGAKYWERPPEI